MNTPEYHLKTAAINRLAKIDWHTLQGLVDVKHVDYLWEYFRRAAEFVASNGLSTDLAFFDAAELLCPGQILLDKDAEEVLLKVSAAGASGLVRAICKSHLKLTILASSGEPRTEGHLGLYEPLIDITESGVDLVGVRKGELILGIEGYAIPLAGWQERARARAGAP